MVSFRDGFGIAERLGHHVPVSIHSYRGDWYNAPSGRGVTSPSRYFAVRVDREKRAGSKNKRKNEALLTILAGDEKP